MLKVNFIVEIKKHKKIYLLNYVMRNKLITMIL